MFGGRRRKLTPSSSSSKARSRGFSLKLDESAVVDVYYGKFMACFRHRGGKFEGNGLEVVDDEGEERAVFSEDESDDSDDDDDFFLKPPRPLTTSSTCRHSLNCLASPTRSKASSKAPPASPLKVGSYKEEEEETSCSLIRPLSCQNLSEFNGAGSGSESDDEFDDASESLEELLKRDDSCLRSRCSSSTASTSTISSSESETDDDKSSVVEDDDQVVADEVEEEQEEEELPESTTLSPQSSFEDGKPLRKSKSVDFSDTHYMVLIPALSDYDAETKKEMWWSHQDFMNFRMMAFQQMSKLVEGSTRRWWEEEEEECC